LERTWVVKSLRLWGDLSSAQRRWAN